MGTGFFGGSGGQVLATGQATQYSAELDDGYYHRGLAKSLSLRNTGQHAGTTNVDLPHYQAATIAFVAATKKITDTAAGLAMFKTGDTVVVTGSALNNGAYTVATGGVASEIVVAEALLDEAAGLGALLSKRAAWTNNCAVDDNTGLMWTCATTKSYKLGVLSDGKLPWTGQLYDIFALAVAANAAALAGYSDWRVPNLFELLSLLILEAPAAAVPAALGWPALGSMHTSTTVPGTVANSFQPAMQTGSVSSNVKTTECLVTLVRG